MATKSLDELLAEHENRYNWPDDIEGRMLKIRQLIRALNECRQQRNGRGSEIYVGENADDDEKIAEILIGDNQ